MVVVGGLRRPSVEVDLRECFHVSVETKISVVRASSCRGVSVFRTGNDNCSCRTKDEVRFFRRPWCEYHRCEKIVVQVRVGDDIFYRGWGSGEENL